MSDTPRGVEARLSALVAGRSGSYRVRMACEMFTLPRVLIAANIRAEASEVSATELRVKIFERTYGHDLDAEDRARVSARLRAGPVKTVLDARHHEARLDGPPISEEG